MFFTDEESLGHKFNHEHEPSNAYHHSNHVTDNDQIRRYMVQILMKRYALENKAKMLGDIRAVLKSKADKRKVVNERVIVKIPAGVAGVDNLQREIRDAYEFVTHGPEKLFNLFLNCIDNEVNKWPELETELLSFILCTQAEDFFKAFLCKVFTKTTHEIRFHLNIFKATFEDSLSVEFRKILDQINKFNRIVKAIKNSLRKRKYREEFKCVGDFLTQYFRDLANTNNMMLNLFENNNHMPDYLNNFISSRLTETVRYAIPTESLILLYFQLRKNTHGNDRPVNFSQLLQEILPAATLNAVRAPLAEMERMFSSDENFLFDSENKEFNETTQKFIDDILLPTQEKCATLIKDGNASFFEVALPDRQNSVIFFTVSSNGLKLAGRILSHLTEYYQKSKPSDPLFVFIMPSGNAAAKESIAMLGSMGISREFRPFKPCSEPAEIGVLSEIYRICPDARVLRSNNVSIAEVKNNTANKDPDHHIPLCDNCKTKRASYIPQLMIARILPIIEKQKINKSKSTHLFFSCSNPQYDLALSHSGVDVMDNISSNSVNNPLWPLFKKNIFIDPDLSREDVFNTISGIYLDTNNEHLTPEPRSRMIDAS